MERSLFPMMEEEEEDAESAVHKDHQQVPVDKASPVNPADNGGDKTADDPSTNMFDSLCQGLATSLHMIRTSVDELQSLKNELLTHSLPPKLLARLTLCVSKIFRSVSDCHVPASELVRLVQLYSAAWDESSVALTKLHDGYNAKKIQLEIALRKLALNNGKMQRMEQQRRLMNWEKLFLRTLVAQELGDKYEEAMSPLRSASTEGTDALRQLVFQMNDLPAARELVRKQREQRLSIHQAERRASERSVESYGDENAAAARQNGSVVTDDDDSINGESKYQPDEVNVLTLETANVSVHGGRSPADGFGDRNGANDRFEEPDVLSFSRAASSKSERPLTRDGASIRSARSAKSGTVQEADAPGTSRATSSKSVHSLGPDGSRSRLASAVQPVKCDAQVSTNDAEYDRYLYVRVFAPEGLQVDLPARCIVMMGDQWVSTNPLYSSVEHSPVPPAAATSSVNLSVKRGGRRGLIGSRNSSAGNISNYSSGSAEESDSRSNSRGASMKTKDPSKPRYEDCIFWLTDDMLKGKDVIGNQLTFTMYSTLGNQQLGVATIGMDDLNNLDLTSFFLPPPHGVGENSESGGTPANDGALSTRSSPYPSGPEVKHAFDGCPDAVHSLSDRVNGVRPTNFPLFPPAGAADNAESQAVSIAKVPVSLCWVKRERPRTFDRVTQSESINDIVFDITGADIASFSKEIVKPELCERSVSAMTGALTEEDVISRTEYMKVLRNHEDELQIMKAEYETRLQDLTEALQMMHESQEEEFQLRVSSSEVAPRSREGRPRSPTVRTDGQGAPLARARTTLETITEPPVHRERPTRSVPPRNIDTPDTNATNWGEEIPKNFYDRLRHFEERVRQRREELRSRNREQTSDAIEKRLADQKKLSRQSQLDSADILAQDVSLPAVFMPMKTRDLNIYNPRAHQYFHPTGAGKLRLTQPPSMVQLPPIPQNNLSVVNLFDICRNFRRCDSVNDARADWLIGQYMNRRGKSDVQSLGVDATAATDGDVGGQSTVDGPRETEIYGVS